MNGASFAPPVINPFGIQGRGGLARPDFVDIDGDGDEDLFVGTATGTVIFFRNTGSRTNPNFVRGDNNPFGLNPVIGAAAPNFVDVENDGDFDAFIGSSSGTTTYLLNTGSPTNPLFINLASGGFGNPIGSSNLPIQLPEALPDVGSNATPFLADINADGFLDAFIGGNNGTVNFTNAVAEGGDYPVSVNLGDGNVILGGFQGVGNSTEFPARVMNCISSVQG